MNINCYVKSFSLIEFNFLCFSGMSGWKKEAEAFLQLVQELRQLCRERAAANFDAMLQKIVRVHHQHGHLPKTCISRQHQWREPHRPHQ